MEIAASSSPEALEPTRAKVPEGGQLLQVKQVSRQAAPSPLP
jgi:hypothetical protein